MTKSKIFVALLMCAAVCTRAEAQLAEVGGGVSGVFLRGGGDFWGAGLQSAGIDARGSVSLSDRFALETFVTYGRRSIPVHESEWTVTGGDTQRVEGLYGIVVRQRLRAITRPGFHMFVSYGLGGVYAHETTPARQYKNGRFVFDVPGFSYTEHDGFLFPMVGVGVHKSVGEHLAIRVEAQLVTFLSIPAGVRVSAGVAVPLGGQSTSPSR